MRWVFFSLLLINMVYFAWQMVVPEHQNPDSPRANRAGDVATIYLLDEAEDLARPREEQSIPEINLFGEEKAAVEEPAEPVSDTVCDALGPFFDRDQGVRLVDFLSSQDISGEIYAENLQSTSKYWVYVEPLEAVADALALRVKLSKEGIDSYLVSEGARKNGLSVGLYNEEVNAQAMIEQLNQLAIEAKIEEKRSEINEYWVLLTEQKLNSLDSEKSQQIREFTYQNQVIQKVCKPIASLQ